MENPTLGIRCRIVTRIPTGIHRFDGNSHKIRSESYRIRVGPVVGLNLLGVMKKIMVRVISLISLIDFNYFLRRKLINISILIICNFAKVYICEIKSGNAVVLLYSFAITQNDAIYC